MRDARKHWWVRNLEAVKRRWAAGESAGLIASTTAGAPSRNGIIGKMHREGLLRGGEGEPRGRKPRAAETKPRTNRCGGRKPAWPPKAGAEPALRVVAYDPARVKPITEVRGCLYPVEERDGEHLFCNAPRGGGPYCPAHREITRGGSGTVEARS
jgi:hypothetical protein